MATVTRDRYIAERQDDGDWLLMTSDGAIRAFETAEAVYAFVQRREGRRVRPGGARVRPGGARVSAIEWRNVPDGWSPPGACAHNEMVPNDGPVGAWKCAQCGYVYGGIATWLGERRD